MHSNGEHLVRLATHLVGAYVANNRIPRSQLPTLIDSVHGAFARLLVQPAQQPAQTLNGASRAGAANRAAMNGAKRRR